MNKDKILEALKKCYDQCPDNNKIFKFSYFDRPEWRVKEDGSDLHIDYLIIGNACFIISADERKELEEWLKHE